MKISRVKVMAFLVVFVLLGAGLQFNQRVSAAGIVSEVPEGFIGIYTIDDLNMIRENLSGHYILMNDLNLSESTSSGGQFYNDGMGWEPIGTTGAPFTGIFDGNGYEISGLKIKDRKGAVGLFGAASQANFKNIGLVNGEITVENISPSSSYYGSLIGKALDTTIERSFSGVQIDVKGYSGFVGGFAGELKNSSIVDSFSYGNISIKRPETIGYTPSATAGTLAGISDGKSSITNSYSVGRLAVFVQSYDSSTGILSKGHPQVTNSYYIKDQYMEPYNDPKAKTLEEMLKPSTYEGFNFVNGWIMDRESEYPFPKFNSTDILLKENTEEFSGGMGTAFSPYKVANGEHLDSMRSHLNSYFVLANDIELTGTAWEPIGTGMEPFTGSLNGQGYSISGLSINLRSDKEQAAGLFGYAKGASIKDLGLVNGSVQVHGSSSDGIVYTGGIAGHVQYSQIQDVFTDVNLSENAKDHTFAGGITGYLVSSKIMNSYNLGPVNGHSGDNWTYAGGITGLALDSIVTQVYNSGDIQARSTFDGANAGGITGGLTRSKLTDTYNVGNVHSSSWSGNPSTGALSGAAMESEVRNSYSMGKLTESSLSGEMPGQLIGNNSKTMVSKSYYYSSVASETGEDPYLLSKEELLTESSFEGFDFTEVWKMGGSNLFPYPVLVKQEFAVEEKAETIEFKSLPEKLVYQEGEELDLTGAVLEVKSNFLREFDVPVTGDMLSGFFQPYQPGDQRLSVSYGRYSLDFTVTVIEKDRTAPDMPQVDEITEQTVLITGVAEPGSDISVEVGNSYIGKGKADEDGEFAVEINQQSVGTVVFITATDEAGNMSVSAILTVKGAPFKGWIERDNHWFYYADGSFVTGWKYIDGKWYFLDYNGVMQTGWVKSGIKWYYLDSSGAMKTGWLKDGTKWYYLESSGAMKTGWLKDGGKWYYLESSGAMKTGWLKSGGKWYYLESSGVMKTGWLKSGGKWYYLDNGGVMKTGWIQSGGKWYYLYSSGVMAYSTTIGGYKLGADGAWIQ